MSKVFRDLLGLAGLLVRNFMRFHYLPFPFFRTLAYDGDHLMMTRLWQIFGSQRFLSSSIFSFSETRIIVLLADSTARIGLTLWPIAVLSAFIHQTYLVL